MNTESDIIALALREKIKQAYENSRVLIVSGNKTMRISIKKILASLGFNLSNVDIVEDISSARAAINNSLPEIIISSLFIEGTLTEELVSLQKNYSPKKAKCLFFYHYRIRT